jgi:3-hydroxyisobutyrate dehydrogenase
MVNNLPNNTLEIMKNEWDELLKAVKNAAHVYHLFALSTADGNKPELRTVVLREVDNDKYIISFHTDTRSPKYKQILNNPAISALFYDPVRRIQLRVKGSASPSNDKKLLKTLWSKLNEDSRQCYQGDLAPSDTLPNDIIINQIPNKSTDTDKSMYGFENFTRITIQVTEIEILMLHHLGHKRLKCKLNCEPIETQWLAS